MMTMTKMLDENTSSIHSQKNLTYLFSNLEEVTTEEDDINSSLGSLKLRNVNRLILSQININPIKNKFQLLFSLASNNIHVLLISETTSIIRFPRVNFVKF